MPEGAPGCNTTARAVPEMTARMNDAEATAAAPAANPTCRRELGDWSKVPRNVAANPPRKALIEAICRAVSAKKSELAGCITSNENKMSDGGRGRASLGVKVWRSSQKWSVRRSAVRSIAWLGASRAIVNASLTIGATVSSVMRRCRQ